ncbi:MAG: hypothetical protein ACTH2A_07155 [Glutamicibacter ardleyensis]
MSEMEPDSWLRSVDRRLDARTLVSRVEEAHAVTVYQLTEMRTAWHNSRSHRYRGIKSLFEDRESAEEAIEKQRKSGTFFSVSSMVALKILAGDDYLVFVHLNTSRPFYGWNAPDEWGKPNSLLWLGTVHDAIRPLSSPVMQRFLSGWTTGMRAPDLLIGIANSPYGRWDWSVPLEVEMDSYTSKGVRPAAGDSMLGYLRESEPTQINTEGLRLAIMSINNAAAKSPKS